MTCRRATKVTKVSSVRMGLLVFCITIFDALGIAVTTPSTDDSPPHVPRLTWALRILHDGRPPSLGESIHGCYVGRPNSS